MIQQDYILRVIREFGKALELFLKRKKSYPEDMKLEKIHELYDAYVGPSEFYHTATLDDVMDSFGRFDADERLPRMEMLAELYYVEADLKTGLAREMMLQRALPLFLFIDRHGKTYSFERLRRISEIQKELHRETGAQP